MRRGHASDPSATSGASARERARLRALHAITAALSTATTADDVDRVIVDRALPALGASAGLIVRIRGDAGLELVDASGSRRGHLEAFAILPREAWAPIAAAIGDRAALFFESRAALAERFPVAAASAPRDREAWIVLPFMCGDRALGGLLASFDAPHRFRADERAFAIALGQLCARVLERVARYEAAIEARATAEAIAEARRAALSMVAHDLRTPLTAISATTSLLARRSDADVFHLDRIARAADQMTDWLAGMLDLASHLAGKLRLRCAPHDLAAITREVIAILEPSAAEAGIAIALDAPAPAIAACDRARVAQIVMNLIGNAVKFSPPGSRVDVTIETVAHEVIVAVSDPGPGIPIDVRARVFEAYWQARPDAGGSGLGLAIAHAMVTAHGGRIWVDDPPQGGARLAFALPVEAP